MVGVPVIINHKDLNKENADDERVGVVNSVWYDEKDGWYWCDGIIWDETAQNLITDKNWSVSCSYDVKTANDEGGSENNIKYDMEFLDGVFTHLALVDNPRYERANIVLNSKTEFVKDNKMEIENENDEKGKWVTIKGTHVFIPDGKTIEEVVEKKFGDKANKQSDKDRIKIADLKSRENEVLKQFYEAKEGSSEREHLQYELDALKDERFRLEDKQSDKPSEKDKGSESSNFDKKYSEIEKIIKDKNWEPLEEESALEELEDYKREFNKNLEPRQEEALLEKLDDFKNKVLDKYPKFNNPKDKGSEGKKEIQQLKISGGGEALSNHAYSAYPTQVKRLEEKGEVEKGVYGEGGNAGKTAVFKSLLDKHKNESLGQICDALNKSEITYRNWQPADGYEKDDKVIDFGKQGAELWAKDYNGNWHSLYLNNGNVNNSKEQDMALIEELKKLITKVENEKGDDMADDKEKNEVENENVDKRKLIDEVGGILKGKVDDEVIRTIIGKLEKVAYDKSEAGTADNEKEEDDKKDDAENCKKVKNEDDEKEVKEVKEEVKEDVENKCKNSVDNSKTDYFAKLNEIYNSASQAKETTDYVSRADREKAAEDYFAK